MSTLLRRAPFTLAILVLIGLAFVAEILLGGSTDQRVLVRLGANVWPLQGEYWRLLASMFLHIGFIHVLVNSWALYQLGALFETWVGSGRMALVYLVSGIAGSVASLFFTLAPAGGHSISAGASGAIFGILGALISFLVRRRDRLTSAAKGLLVQLLFWAGLNVFLGMSVEAIDNSAHMGGFVAGLGIGAFLKAHRRYRRVPDTAAADGGPAQEGSG